MNGGALAGYTLDGVGMAILAGGAALLVILVLWQMWREWRWERDARRGA